MVRPIGIPTIHSDIQYRSRLEAKWAAFLEMMKWPFEYEPFDLSGWIPDFILTGAVPVLVEVKPVTEFPGAIAAEIDRAYPTSEGEAMILGCTIFRPQPNFFGWHRSAGRWGPAVMAQWYSAWYAGDKDHIGFTNILDFKSDSLGDRISGRSCMAGGKEDSLPLYFHQIDEIRVLWKRAANVTQWKGKQNPGG